MPQEGGVWFSGFSRDHSGYPRSWWSSPASRSGSQCGPPGSPGALTGCDLSTHSGVDAALWAMLGFNYRVQATLFNPQRLAETYPASTITRPSRFNAAYPIWEVRPVPEDWRL